MTTLLEVVTQGTPTLTKVQNGNLPVTNQDIITMLFRIFGTSDPTDKKRFEDEQTSHVLESGEKKLWFAVLKGAFLDYQTWIAEKALDNSTIPPTNSFQEIFDWFFNPSPTEEYWSGSFIHVCQVFDLEPDYVRKMLIQWTKNHYQKESS